jgi:DNA-binding Lrp family transcriptional regulator
MKSLTKRQREFLSKLLDLYDQEDAPVHYSQVAKRLGVGKVTAYEMLRLLEERGLTQAEYQRPEGKRGPGRASVVFRPTPRAVKAMIGLADGRWRGGEWEDAKAHILEQIQVSSASEYEILLDEILAHLPDQRSPVIYLTEMVAAVALGLHSIKDIAEVSGIRRTLKKIGLPGELDLSALTGLSLSLSLVDRINKHVAHVLQTQAKKYQAFLSELNTENRRRLAEFTREVIHILGI